MGPRPCKPMCSVWKSRPATSTLSSWRKPATGRSWAICYSTSLTCSTRAIRRRYCSCSLIWRRCENWLLRKPGRQEENRSVLPAFLVFLLIHAQEENRSVLPAFLVFLLIHALIAQL